jgi:hypothetical protein
MKLKTTIITFLISCNSLLAQNSDLFYKKTETKQAPTSNTASKNKPISLNEGQKPFQINFGDARSWFGASYRINISNGLSFGPGIHYGKMSLSEDDESISLVTFSGLFRYKPEKVYFKFGPYFNIPSIEEASGFDFEEATFLPGLALGGGYEFDNGFDVGLTQHLDLFFLAEAIEGDYNPLWLLPSISLSYHFGKPKNTKSISNQNQSTTNYNLVPTESNSPATVSPINTKSNYTNYSDEELKKLLDQATAAEKYSEANDIQAEITKRIEQNKYSKLSTEELKKQLEAALKAEDYTKAEALQKEIDKRVSQKKDKTTPDKSSKEPAKKSVKDLEQDLKKAMDAEDYKKADEIQKEINKLKKP